MSKILAPILTLVGLLSEVSQSAVLITFDEVSGNVVASSSGTFIVPTTLNATFNITSPLAGATSQTLLWEGQGSVNRYSGGIVVDSGISSIMRPSGRFSAFGYSQGSFFAPSSQA